MKTSGVSQVSVTATGETEEPIAALLERIFSVTPTVYSDAESQQSTITAYVRGTPAELRKHTAEIRIGLSDLKQLGLDVGYGEIRVARVRREDWAESWKKHFKPITIGSALIIKPSWSKLKPKKGQAVVVLDPGLSFGTGQHATTSFCLRQIVACAKRFGVLRGSGALEGRRPGRGDRMSKAMAAGRNSKAALLAALQGAARGSSTDSASILDIGCGSGILAIAAAKLGFAPVEAFDFDPVAARIGQKNCRTNRVEKKVKVARRDLTKIPLDSRRKYDVVCANLMAPLLIAERDRILNRLAPGGTLILAGILATEFDAVQKRYEAAGMKLIADRTEREWRSGAFREAVGKGGS